ncbi:glycosyltransferase family protein [Algoriphagus namhaensis]
MRFLFLVQGEGRGHMTQAMTLSETLEKMGHEVSSVIIGKSKRREIPEFFSRHFQGKLTPVESPNFVTDKQSKRIKLWSTIRYNLFRSRNFRKSLSVIDQIVKQDQPDVLLNFYDLLGGIYFTVYRPEILHWTIGHQYLSLHPSYTFPKGKLLSRQLYLLNTKITAFGASLKLALSFVPMESTQTIRVFPPLIRAQLKAKRSTDEGFYLAYMVNSGYAEEVISFAKNHPHIRIKAFWDRKGVTEVQQALPNLSYHPIDDQAFLTEMAACKGLVCTAGFESICEARYLGKPILVIPVAGQYEQACNAEEVVNLRIGNKSKTFDFNLIDSASAPSLALGQENFRTWEDRWTTLLEKLIQLQSSTASTANLEDYQLLPG